MEVEPVNNHPAIVRRGIEVRNLSTGECCFIPEGKPVLSRRAKKLMQDITLANGLESLADRLEGLLQEPITPENQRVMRQIKAAPEALYRAARFIRGGGRGAQ
tara:strand:- start:342 stop:650 length:309 start_codon:yes stop_codon:yes gene_type:complete